MIEHDKGWLTLFVVVVVVVGCWLLLLVVVVVLVFILFQIWFIPSCMIQSSLRDLR